MANESVLLAFHTNVVNYNGDASGQGDSRIRGGIGSYTKRTVAPAMRDRIKGLHRRKRGIGHLSKNLFAMERMGHG